MPGSTSSTTTTTNTTIPVINSPLRPPGPHLPLELQADYVGIESATDVDVLCGRGVTTNRHPGNAKFRSLIGCNKELYVTSTKKQKMGISRSIVEAVRGLGGRFLEKDTETGLYFDIGDKKAVEKCSQALRDGAAALRKQLSDDLNDPDFLNAVFDTDGGAADVLSKTSKSPKTTSTKKGHRRTKSNPVPVSHSREAIHATRRKSGQHVMIEPVQQEQPTDMSPATIFNEVFELSAGFDDLLPPLPPQPPTRKHHRSHRRVHSSTSAPVFGGGGYSAQFDMPYQQQQQQQDHPLLGGDRQEWTMPLDDGREVMSAAAPTDVYQPQPRFGDHPLLTEEPPVAPMDGIIPIREESRGQSLMFGEEEEDQQNQLSSSSLLQSDPSLSRIMQEPILEIPLTTSEGGDDDDVDDGPQILADVQRDLSALLEEDNPAANESGVVMAM